MRWQALPLTLSQMWKRTDEYALTPHPVKSNDLFVDGIFLKEMYLAIKMCICYNANRQKEMQKFHVNKERNPRTVLQHSSGILLYFYSGKAPTRLFVALVVAV